MKRWPDVNGLAQSYADQIAFRSYNIASAEGRAWAEQFNLRGHPAYLLLDACGKERWRALGVIPKDTIEVEIRSVLS